MEKLKKVLNILFSNIFVRIILIGCLVLVLLVYLFLVVNVYPLERILIFQLGNLYFAVSESIFHQDLSLYSLVQSWHSPEVNERVVNAAARLTWPYYYGASAQLQYLLSCAHTNLSVATPSVPLSLVISLGFQSLLFLVVAFPVLYHTQKGLKKVFIDYIYVRPVRFLFIFLASLLCFAIGLDFILVENSVSMRSFSEQFLRSMFVFLEFTYNENVAGGIRSYCAPYLALREGTYSPYFITYVLFMWDRLELFQFVERAWLWSLFYQQPIMGLSDKFLEFYTTYEEARALSDRLHPKLSVLDPNFVALVPFSPSRPADNVLPDIPPYLLPFNTVVTETLAEQHDPFSSAPTFFKLMYEDEFDLRSEPLSYYLLDVLPKDYKPIGPRRNLL